MAQPDALLRLNRTLVARRADLCKTLGDELANLRDFEATDWIGDNADVAFENICDEMSSQLAELDSRELTQIERALARLKQGKYGICEGGSHTCQRRIPVARLKALPDATLCINCERELEKRRDCQHQCGTANWDHVFDSEMPLRDERVTFAELAIDFSRNRRGQPRAPEG